MDYQLLWFGLLGVLLAGYAVLDGFDFGVGIVHLWVAKDDTERRLIINAIGPLWDGNEVWLVTFGGALFAAFPIAYASVFSGLYLPFMLLLVALIFRATAIEFRSKSRGRRWRGTWDVAFSAASLLAALLMGAAIGNSLWGLSIGARGIYQGGVLDAFNPYALAVGLLAAALFAMHGTIYLYLKMEGELQARLLPWMWRTFGLFLVLYLLVTIATLVLRPQVTRNLNEQPWLWIVVLLNILAIANIPRAIYLQRPGYAFVSSCATILALVALFGAALFPYLVVSSVAPEHSLTIYNAASSDKTLGIMALMALIGMPLVLTYTGIVYWTFRGKVKLGEFSY
jgi:cytochrome d ubiquinol oxidase subunit II